jgi:hypothetical protein
MLFQQQQVRTSIPFYRNFILVMARSPRLRVYHVQLKRPIRTRFRYDYVPKALNLAAHE